METSVSYTDKTAYLSSDEQKWIRRVKDWKAKLPDYVDILAEPENNDGCIYCKIPADWISIRPRKGLFMTDEEKAVIGRRLKAYSNSPSK